MTGSLRARLLWSALLPLTLLPVAFGALGHRGGMMAGIKSTAAGYLLLAFGAALGMALALALHGNTVSDLTSLHWVNYWSKVDFDSLLAVLINYHQIHFPIPFV